MKQRTTILLVFTVFLAPVVLATLMHSRWWRFEPETRSYGELVEPVVHLDDFNARDSAGRVWHAADLNDHWTLLAVSDHPCGTDCLDRLEWLARLRETQGRHRDRLQTIVVGSDLSARDNVFPHAPAPNGVIVAAYPHSGQPADAKNDWRRRLPRPLDLTTTYLIDPAGNIILVYSAAADPTGIRKDLKRILTWSKADTA